MLGSVIATAFIAGAACEKQNQDKNYRGNDSDDFDGMSEIWDMVEGVIRSWHNRT